MRIICVDYMCESIRMCYVFFFFNDTATTEIYTLSLHDALPISLTNRSAGRRPSRVCAASSSSKLIAVSPATTSRSEEHTSELQSRQYLVCRLLLEKKKIHLYQYNTSYSSYTPLL